MSASIILKWGNLKGWTGLTEDHPAREPAARFLEGLSMSATERLDAEKKEQLCKVIDLIDGTITNDWSGEDMSKEEAKAYVRGYA